MEKILVVNAGSSSIKTMLFGADLTPLAAVTVAEIGGQSTLRICKKTVPISVKTHLSALSAILDTLAEEGHPLTSLSAAAHRVVHGGRGLLAPCQITSAVEAEIESCIPLAPLHNPHNLSAIRAIRRLAPDLRQYASFDTSFHATNPEEALRYALPEAEEAKGIRRYGFHGISYSGVVSRFQEITENPLPQRLLAMHLGNGASLCAIRDGRSVATTMGYSPLDGLTMGTRTGEIDGNAVLRIAADHGIDRASAILNRESGLRALGGSSDMRTLAEAGTPKARFARKHFCYWIIRHAGSMIAAMGGLDAVVFTGGIGENDTEVRAEVAAGLGWLGAVLDARANAAGGLRLHAETSKVQLWKILAYEEQTIARDALAG